MFRILKKEQLAEDVYRMTIHAPRISVRRKVGQFVVVRPAEKGERIPLTVAQADPQALSITIVFQAVGESTRQLAERMLVELHRSRYRFFHKHYSPAFCWAHRQITRLGLARRARQDRKAHRRGEISTETLAARLSAYNEIECLKGGK